MKRKKNKIIKILFKEELEITKGSGISYDLENNVATIDKNNIIEDDRNER